VKKAAKKEFEAGFFLSPKGSLACAPLLLGVVVKGEFIFMASFFLG
jgi:hypothetical protein